jgi:hypothetical protein
VTLARAFLQTPSGRTTALTQSIVVGNNNNSNNSSGGNVVGGGEGASCTGAPIAQRALRNGKVTLMPNFSARGNPVSVELFRTGSRQLL